MPGRIFGMKKEGMTVKYYIKKGLIELRKVAWRGKLVGIGVRRHVQNILVGMSETKKPGKRPGPRRIILRRVLNRNKLLGCEMD